MAEPKTRPTDASVDAFIADIPDETRRNDAIAITALMAKVTKQKPVMWGGAIIGFDSAAITYANGIWRGVLGINGSEYRPMLEFACSRGIP